MRYASLAMVHCSLDVEPSSSQSTAYALRHIDEHGSPYVLLVDSGGRIRAADRRDGCRALLARLGTSEHERLPDSVARVVGRHRREPPRDDGPTVAVLRGEIVVSIVSLGETDELVACSLWTIRRDRLLEIARVRYALTNRECELLDRVLHGNASSEIASTLSISLATVEWHTKRLLQKTESQNRTQMASRVLGFLPDPT